VALALPPVYQTAKGRKDSCVIVILFLLIFDMLENSSFDIVVRGEGDQTIVELVTALKGNLPLSHIRGISYKEDGKLYTNEDRPS
jgi:radical SAM superfamily enzyme YgiQ (UPF0313 family)